MKKLALIVAMLVVAWPVLAEDNDPQWLLELWPSAQSCSPDKIHDVRLDDVLKIPRDQDGQCVRIKGYYNHRALFLDPDDMVVKYASSSKETKGKRIGVSASEQTMENLQGRYDQQYVELIGIIWQCEEKGPWMGGYCHYVEKGPFIGVISVKMAREPYQYRDN